MLQFLPPPTPSPSSQNAPAAFLEAPGGIVEPVEVWNTSCLDWEERILDGRSLVPDLPLYPDEAARALRVFKRLRLPDVIGTPTMGEACGPWFFPIVAALFGSYDPATNIRRISEVFQLIPKGNSKSSNGGAVMLTALIVNRRPEAEFMFVAPTMEIAAIAFKQARGTIRLDSELPKIFHIQDHLKRITHRMSGATLQIKAADTDTITGSKCTGTMIDETHQFAAKSKAAEIFIELRGALTKRTDGFLFQTTTQSKATPIGMFAAELEMARAVRDGKMVGIPLLPVLYEFPDRLARDDGWRNPAYWPSGQSQPRALDQRRFPRARGDAGRCRWAGGRGPYRIAAFQRADRNVACAPMVGLAPTTGPAASSKD